MDLVDIIGEAGEALLKSESAIKLGAEFFNKDAEILESLGKLKTPKLTERITEHLVKEGRPGSAEYMGMFFKSIVLDKELGLVESGMFEAQKIEQSGLPMMIDAQQTTPEMIRAGQAILTPEARVDFLGSANTLKYKLDQHIGKTAQRASEYYASELTRERGIAERLQGILGVEPEQYEIPFTPDEAELAKLRELSELKYTTREEVLQTFQRELHRMMRQRPGVIGLEGTASFSKFAGEISQELGGDTTNPVNIQRIRNAHNLMTGRGAMEELQIYPEFSNAIERGIDQDFSALIAIASKSNDI